MAIEARKAAALAGTPTRTELSTVDGSEVRRSVTRVVTLGARRAARAMPTDARPVPSIAAYDQLLTATTATGGVS